MKYPEELREKYNEVLYQELDVIVEFLKKQYDMRYGRQRDSWHFEPNIHLLVNEGHYVMLSDVRLDKDSVVVFRASCDGGVSYGDYECNVFCYGELSRVIEALPDADDIVIKNAVYDLSEFANNLRCDLILQESPFEFEDIKIDNVLNNDGGVHLCVGGRVLAEENFNADFLSKLRDHIHVEHLHRTKEYKEVMQLLALEPNLRKSVDEYDKTNYGCILFTLAGTDIEFDMSAIQRDDKGNLTIFGADTCCEDELITLTEKDIKKEYLEVILKWLRPKYSDIMNTYNGHNAELVRKINAAWKSDEYHDRFGDILFALGSRDKQEIQDNFDIVIDCNETAMDNAHEIMEHVCDDWDLETILSFIRYK